MDTRNSALVVGLYLAGVVIVVMVCLLYYTHQRLGAGPSVALDPPDARSVSHHANLTNSAPYYHASRVKADQSLLELRASLANTNNLLDKRNLALNEKNAECKALKAELDQSFTLILSLLADDSNDESATRESTQRAKSKLETELSQLLESLNQSQVLSAEQERQLAKLRSDLQQTDLEMAVLHEQSELEFAALHSERKAFESAVSDVVARCGMAAVPVLVDRLSDERLEVRRWAAKVLGVIGPEAVDALPALQRLRSDPDSSVRLEAEHALSRIQGISVD